MGSVKDLKIVEQALENKMGIGQFRFSDRYSVFDWGEMTDHIEGKGKSLCLIGAYFFEKLESMGMKTHYLGVVENGEVKKLAETKQAVDTMQVNLVRVLKPGEKDGSYDYSVYNDESTNMLIPLEVIYRNTLPAGSSVFKRLENGSIKLADLGLKEMPRANDRLDKPVFDVSTKLEITDRYMNWDEAKRISNLSDSELEKIQNYTAEINGLITEQVGKIGLTNEDGKVEFAFNHKRELMLVDVLATPDECRFNFTGIPVSKEVARIYYRKTDWFQEVENAKKQDRAGWKQLVKNPPPPLPKEFLQLISYLYQSFCNEITERRWFDAPPLKEILSGIKMYIG